MKKLFALILALSVLCSFSVIAQAADNTVADDTAMLEENMILAREKATTFLNDFDSSLNVTLWEAASSSRRSATFLLP